jgi:hypothetical protein
MVQRYKKKPPAFDDGFNNIEGSSRIELKSLLG